MLAGVTMGTTFSIKFAPSESVTLEEVSKRVNAELASVNMQMSTYIDDSELSKFNSSSVEGQWMAVSTETVETIVLAQKISEATDGAFDVTVGPLVRAWGFGPDGRPNQIPSDGEIAELSKVIGFEKLGTRLEPPALSKEVGRLQVDLSAIAKGHGVDRIAEVLELMGIDSYFVEIGGEIRTAGFRIDGKPWRLGIESPDEDARDLFAVLELSDGALATSGSYRNFYEMDGSRYSHTIDPKTGSPVLQTIVSASVIMETCAEADAIATSMMVLGFEEGLRTADENDWPVFLLAMNEQGVIEIGKSKAFEREVPNLQLVGDSVSKQNSDITPASTREQTQ